MKRATSLAWLIERSNPWLKWWQELIINWAAGWHTVESIVVTSADGEDFCEWSVPSDLDVQRNELERLLP
jgi:hypothetical protein